jgi:hypothetical protein
MDQHLGASITLSFTLVVVFAIILYQPENAPRPPSPPAPSAPAVTPQEMRPPPSEPQPPLTPTAPLAEEPMPVPPRVEQPPVPVLPLVEQPPVPAPVLPVARRAPKPTESEEVEVRPSRPAMTLPAPEGFTRAAEGETLRDVAIRLHGSANHDQVEALWRLNRDLVRSRDTPLRAGMLLRSP